MKTERQRYLDKEITHAEYYRELAKRAGVSYAKASPAFLDRCRRALKNGDKNLNSIPLRIWDARGLSIISPRPAFKSMGDIPSMAGLVCLVKQAVMDAIDSIDASKLPGPGSDLDSSRRNSSSDASTESG